MEEATTINRWLDAVTQAMEEVAHTSLGMPLFKFNTPPNSLPWQDTIGAYVPWVSDSDSVQIGLVSTPQGCFHLAHKLLGSKAAEDVSEEDMADAIREIVNIIGGMSKTIVGGDVTISNMGLPVFIRGYVIPTRQQICLVQQVKLSEADCYLFVIQGK